MSNFVILGSKEVFKLKSCNLRLICNIYEIANNFFIKALSFSRFPNRLLSDFVTILCFVQRTAALEHTSTD